MSTPRPSSIWSAAGYRALQDNAALAARTLAFMHMGVYGNAAACRGWVARARSLGESLADRAESGWIELTEVIVAGSLDEAEQHATAALDIARRFGDVALEFNALANLGQCLVRRGHVAEGMSRLDEAAAAAVSGELGSPYASGEIYCHMMVACEMALDVRRAEQWISVATRFARQSNFVPIAAICRMHYGGLLTAAGRWPEAEEELVTAIRIYDGGYRGGRSGAVVRLADLRVRQGRLDEAGHLLEGYEHDSYASRPLGRLHLARGDVELASTALRRYLRQEPNGILQAPVLGQLVAVEAAAGRTGQAREAAARLSELAGRLETPTVRFLADLAAGTVCRADGSAELLEQGVAHLEAAVEGFGATGLPPEQAAARLELAQLLAGTSPEVAIAEARAALDCFERLSARQDADRAAGLLRSLGAAGRNRPRTGGPLTRRESEMLDLLAEGLSNGHAAARLFISPRTAEHHVSSILAKLGLSSRAEAIAWALRNAGPSSG